MPLKDVERVSGETEVMPGVQLLPSPGHTPGHMCVRVGATLVLGDVVVHELQVANPDLVYISDHDSALAAATRRRILGELADEGTETIVSHFPGKGRFERVGNFERVGKGFRWAVE